MSRKLDALVAERVCGIAVNRQGQVIQPGLGVGTPHRYSTDMNAALGAAERFKGPPEGAFAFSWAIELMWVEDGRLRTGWLASVRGKESDFHANPATALCIALLRAAGVDEAEITAAMEDGS